MMIEDEAITALSAHPGASLLSRSGIVQPGMGRSRAGQSDSTAKAMERETRAIATTFRRQLETEASRVKLNWSFEALRGSVEAVIANTVRYSDIVIYCEPPSSLERETYPERNLWQAVEQSPGAALYRPSRLLPARLGVMVVDGSSNLQEPVDALALQLAQAMREPMRRVDGNGDWRTLASQWERTPPRLIVLARGAMGLANSDNIAQAARTLRVPLLVLEDVAE